MFFLSATVNKCSIQKDVFRNYKKQKTNFKQILPWFSVNTFKKIVVYFVINRLLISCLLI